jgi:hypothetical protein
MNKLSMEFNHSEAKGIITIEEGTFGAWISVNGKCVAMIDLFYLSESGEGTEFEGFPQIAIFNGGDDPVGHVLLMENMVRVRFEQPFDFRYDEGRNLVADVEVEGSDDSI